MVSEKRLNARRATLCEAGVPERFIDELATRRDAPWVAIALGWILCAFATIGFMIACTFKLIYTPSLFYSFVEPHLFLTPALSYVLLCLAAPVLIVIPALIWTPSVFWYARVRPYPAWHIMATWLRSTSPVENRKILDKLLPQTKTVTGEREFLCYYCRASKRRGERFILVVAILSGIVLAGLIGWAMTSYQMITLERVELHRPFHTEAYPLDEVEHVQITCNATGKHSVLKYELSFGAVKITPNLYSEPGRIKEHIDSLIALDRQLNRLRVPIARLDPNGADAGDFEDCLTELASYAQVDVNKLRRFAVR